MAHTSSASAPSTVKQPLPDSKQGDPTSQGKGGKGK